MPERHDEKVEGDRQELNAAEDQQELEEENNEQATAPMEDFEDDLQGFLCDDVMDEVSADDADKPKIQKPIIVEDDPAEAHEAKLKCSPCLPSAEEIARHDATHYPYRNWCPSCVKAKAREDAHFRSGSGTDKETGLPVVSMDYELLEEKITVLIVKDDASGSTLAYDVEAKGPSDEWVLRQLVRDLEDWGRGDLYLKTDGEPAMLAVQRAVAKLRSHRTLPRNPPAYNPQSNGAAEKAVQDVTAHVRCLLLALEARLKVNIDVNLPIIKWIIRHAAFLHTRYSVGHDGLTSWRRLTGRTWNGVVIEFGERVFGKLALRRSPTFKKKKRGKKKLASRSVEGVWLGIYPRTGEHIIARLDTGEAIRVRTVNRMVFEQRWKAEDIQAVRALPRRPNPRRARDGDDPEGQLNVDAAPEARAEPREPRERAAREGGADLGRPVPAEAPREGHHGPRELQINNRILEKYGFTPNCPGCAYKQLDLEGRRLHTAECRRRIYEAMSADADELDRIERTERRLGRVPPKSEQIRRPTAPDAEVPRPAEVQEDGPPLPEARVYAKPILRIPSRRPPRDEVRPHVSADKPVDAEPSSMTADSSHGGGVPITVNEPNMNDEDESLAGWEAVAEQEMVDAQPADEDEIAEGLFGPDDEDTDEEARIQAPEEKRQRLAHFEQKSQQLNNIHAAMQRSDAKEIIKDLEKLAEFKLPKNRRQRRTLHQNGYSSDVGEVYSPPRVTKIASDMGLRPAWALDLTELDPSDGLPWDFSCEAKRRRAKKLLMEDKPLMLIACPMCGPFSTIMHWNYAEMSEIEAKQKLSAAMEHLKFAVELCLTQYQAGRLFLFEHPVGASSWDTELLKVLARLEGVFMANFDFCQLGMKAKNKQGVEQPAKKRTKVMTNSKNIAEVLRLAQCTRVHEHVQLLDGRAGPCQVYPDKFVKLICSGIQKEIDDIRWRDRLAEKLDITETLNMLMAAAAKLDELAVPPHEEDETTSFDALYKDGEFFDDVSGAKLDKKMATTARRTEIDFFKARGVYFKRRREKWMKVISTKWLDVNKGDAKNPNYRARLVGREMAWDRRDDLFAATPPLESLKAVLSLCASRQNRRHPHRIMKIDVKRAYFYAKATRPIFISIPKEDFETGDEQNVAQLNLSLYGTRDAAKNWTATFTEFLVNSSFTAGLCSPCNFHNAAKDMAVTVHGDDFTCTGSRSSLAWFKGRMEEKFEISCEVLGPDADQQREISILNRTIAWTKDGLTYEADQRHAEIVIRELGLQEARATATPGARDELAKASAPGDAEAVEIEDESPPLNPSEASAYRGVAARLNYLAQDRPDIQYACKEASRRMAKPRSDDWLMLKRIGRYLVGAPRLVQRLVWQDEPESADVYTDSDWAGCRSTCRSTSGGLEMFGQHCLKSWSSTQATVALSSAEAELYALTKGTAQGLGLVSLMADFGVAISVTVHTDASAAIGIVRRAGLGKLRHLNVRYLWIQGQVKSDAIKLLKVLGTENPADLLTKNLHANLMAKHLEYLGMNTAKDRAASAPTLSQLVQDDGDHSDYWEEKGENIERVHCKARTTLFTPLRVSGSPPVRALAPSRVTEGRFLDNGEVFKKVDSWTARGTAHMDLTRRWVGTTRFLKRCG